MSDEIRRIIQVYKHYRKDITIQERWNPNNPGNQTILQERHQAMKMILKKHGFWPLKGLRILDVGCGKGDVLASLLQWGAQPENLFGVDLIFEHVMIAKQRYSNLNFQCANAEYLEFKDECFDLVLLFTVFSSILDDITACNIAREITRVLRPKGAVLWYDFRYKNPKNPHVRAMKKYHIYQFFPNFKIHLQTITLFPPLARRLGKFTPLLYPTLSKLPFLRTHYLALLIKYL